MEQLLICMSLSLIAGLLASRAAKAVRLPAVTSYLVAGLLLGPFFLGRLGLSGWGFGFGSLAQVESYGIITQVALGFIAFVIGNEFRLSALESMGRQAVTVGILQAVITTVLVDIALVALHFARPDVISMASAITLGSIASATAPAATLMVVKQYKASGPLTRLLLMVVAIDDAVGLVLFSASFGIANALEQGRIDPISILLEPLVEIVLSLGLGALAGLLLNQLEIYFHSRSKRMSLSVAFVLLTVGLSMVSFEVGPIHCSFSLLLVCMMTGTVFCNICPTSDELMDRLDRWVSPVNILFFVLSGAELDLNILANPMVLLIGAVYIASRSLGKISGSYVSCKATRCSEKIQKYLGITLLPQAGVALGMAATAAQLSDGHMVRNVVLFSVLVYELAGPTLNKIALTAAGEIRPEGRTCARVENKPEEVAQKVVFCRNVTQSLTNPVIFCILSIAPLEQFSYCVTDWLSQEKDKGEWNTMKSTGIVRGIDALGRIVLPKELRTSMHLDTDTKLEIFVDGDSIVLKKHRPAGSCDFCGEVDESSVQFAGYCICPACRRKIGAL